MAEKRNCIATISTSGGDHQLLKASMFMFPFSCNDTKKVSLAEATVSSVEKLTADLQDTTRVVAEMASRGNGTLEQSLAYMGVVERMNLLQREWATKVTEIRSFTCSFVWSRSFTEN